MAASTNKKFPMWAIAALVMLLIGGGVWAFSARTTEPPKVAVVEPAKVFDKMRELRERKDLTDDQRHAEFGKLREQMEESFDSRVNAWYAAKTPDDKKRVLDTGIDEWEKRRKEMEEARKKEEQGNAASRPSREDWRNRMRNSTPQERKQRSESRSADADARRRAYMKAAGDRMKERGIKPPQWGGPGGGRGPGGGGGPRRG